MIQQAVASDDPVIFFEPKRRYHEKAEVDETATPLPLHAARVARTGSTATLVTYGPMLSTCLAAAEAATDDGHDLEVIDLRSLSPIDMTVVARSAQKTGRVVTVHEAPLNLGLGAELAARITEQCFYSLEAPVLRVGGFDMPYPPSRVEEEYLPDLDRVLDAVDRALAY
jgi:pyruvate dehydrogenase E1 component beta subunit